MEHLLFFFFLIALSYAFAKIEIQIEGANGWASALPAWKLPESHWVSRLFFGGRPADGYHVWTYLVFLPLVMHTPFLYAPFSLAMELRIISFFVLFLIIEDFLWFVANPAFGLRKFKKEHIWWHAHHWLWIAPTEYIFVIPGIALYVASYWF